MNFYPHHIGDFNNATRHLTRVERALYRDLIELYYDTEQPLPAGDIRAIARRVLAFDDAEIAIVRAILVEFFTLDGDVFRHSRCDAEIEKYRGNIANKKRAGLASAAIRTNKSVTPVEQTLNKRATNQEPLTKNQEPINSVTNVTGGKPPAADSIFAYGVPMLTVAGIAEKQARSFLGLARKTHGDDAVLDALRQCYRAKPLQPLEWLAKVLPPNGGKPSTKSVLDAAKAEIFGHAEQ